MPSKFARRPCSRHLQVSALLLGTLACFAAADEAPRLTIEYGATPKVSFGELTQRFNVANNCSLTAGDDPPLLTIEGSRQLGYAANKGWIGIRQSGQGVPCGRVGAGQSITLGLGDALGDRVIGKATFGLNVKGDVVIDILAKLDGADPEGDVFRVCTGRSTTIGDCDFLFAEGRTDSGPDSEADIVFGGGSGGGGDRG